MGSFQIHIAGTLFGCSHCTSCANCVKTAAVSEKTSCVSSKLQLYPSAYKTAFTAHCHVALQQCNMLWSNKPKFGNILAACFDMAAPSSGRTREVQNWNYLILHKTRGRDRAAGVVTGYGLDSSGVRTAVEAKNFLFSTPVLAGPEAHPAS